jgi:deoxycytidylate deaminase
MPKKPPPPAKPSVTPNPTSGAVSGGSEIVFAMVAAVGVNLKLAEEALVQRLKDYGYECEYIKITEHVLPKLFNIPKAKKTGSDFERINLMMDFGDQARGTISKNILAKGAAAEIAARRKTPLTPKSRTAYIIHSLKHPDEVRELREIYPRGFHLIGVHAHPDFRRKHLMQERRMTKDEADTLMKRDRKEGAKHGQQLVDTFHLADFFVGWGGDDSTESTQATLDLGDVTTKSSAQGYTVNKDRVAAAIHRYVDLVFGHIYRTPTFGEHAMFMAFTASLRSADLSRQVGAVVAKDGEILSNGSNDAPSAQGGLYWPYVEPKTHQVLDVENGRDYKRGYDSNRDEQDQLIKSICDDFKAALTDPKNKKAEEFQKLLAKGSDEIAKATEEIHSVLKATLDDGGIRNLTEYGRIVHAEMEAILSCTRQGKSTKGTTIYCTTFPCHNCAKHIIASGITRVVFIEPYLKSKALDFHDDSIVIHYPHDDSNEDKVAPPNKPRVKFEPFFGVGPRRYLDLFSLSLGVGRPLDRKDKSGQAITWEEKDGKPRLQMHQVSYLQLEADAQSSFKAAVADLKKKYK